MDLFVEDKGAGVHRNFSLVLMQKKTGVGMRGYTFDRTQFAVGEKKETVAESPPPPTEKPPVTLYREVDHKHDDFRPPKVPTNVIWIAAACIAIGVVIWSVASSVQTRRRVQMLERAVRLLAEKQGIYFQSL